MKHRDDHEASRREMLRSGVRYLALTGVSLLSAGLLVRASGPTAADRCSRSPACGNCRALATCRRPQALAAKKRKAR